MFLVFFPMVDVDVAPTIVFAFGLCFLGRTRRNRIAMPTQKLITLLVERVRAGELAQWL